jgi:hypothetical protein
MFGLLHHVKGSPLPDEFGYKYPPSSSLSEEGQAKSPFGGRRLHFHKPQACKM